MGGMTLSDARKHAARIGGDQDLRVENGGPGVNRSHAGDPSAPGAEGPVVQVDLSSPKALEALTMLAGAHGSNLATRERVSAERERKEARLREIRGN